jgi:hypothetical protein
MADETGTPEPTAGTGQRWLIIALVVVVVLLLIGIAFLAGQLLAHKTASPNAVVSPLTSPATSPAPSAAPSQATGSTVLTAAGSLLQAGSGSDAGPGRGNGPGCQIWVDPGWTLGDCNLVGVNGTANSSQMVAYVTQHKTGPGGVQWRIFLMTTTDTDAYWHTKFYFSDDLGGGYTNITVKAVDTTGGGLPDLAVGFRHNKTSGSGTVLDYDILMRAGATAPLQVVAHRQIADGSVVFSPGITDFDSAPGPQFTKSVIRFSSGAFKVTSTSQVPQSSVPASQLP